MNSVVITVLLLFSIGGVDCQKNCTLGYAHDFEFSCDAATLNSSSITWRAHSSNNVVLLNKCTHSLCQATGTFDGVFSASATMDPSFSIIVNSILSGNLTTTNLTTLKTLTKLECASDKGVVNVCDTLDVYADAKITKLSINNKNDTEIVANLGDKVLIECLASGFPSPSLLIGKNGSSLTAVSPGQSLNVTLNTCLDASTYVCRAETHNTVDEKGIDVLINCPLQLVNMTKAVVNAYIYEKPTIAIHVYGHPSPQQFSLNRASGQKVDNATTVHTISYYSDEIPYGVVNLKFYQLKESDFTDYSLSFGNGIGKDTVYSFSLHKLGTSTASQLTTFTMAGCVILSVAVMYLKGE